MTNFEKRKNDSGNCKKHSGKYTNYDNLTKDILDKLKKLETLPKIYNNKEFKNKCPICAYEKGYQDAIEEIKNIPSDEILEEEFDFKDCNKKNIGIS